MIIKRIFAAASAAIAALIMAMPLTAHAEHSNPDFSGIVIEHEGDVNFDGKTNSADIVTIAAYIKGKKGITNGSWYRADVDGNGNVDSRDIVIIAANIRGLRKANNASCGRYMSCLRGRVNYRDISLSFCTEDKSEHILIAVHDNDYIDMTRFDSGERDLTTVSIDGKTYYIDRNKKTYSVSDTKEDELDSAIYRVEEILAEHYTYIGSKKLDGLNAEFYNAYDNADYAYCFDDSGELKKVRFYYRDELADEVIADEIKLGKVTVVMPSLDGLTKE